MAARNFAFRTLHNAKLATYSRKPIVKCIMGYLGMYGSQSISSIQKKINTPDYLLEYIEVNREIELLIKLGLVKEQHYSFQKTQKRIMGLTFEGLIWYFRDLRELDKPADTKDRIDFFMKTYKMPYVGKSKHRKNRFILEGFKELLPFLPLWNKMMQQIGNDCLERLEFTVNNFYVGIKTLFTIPSLGLEIETYLNYSGELFDGDFSPRNDPLVTSFLESEEAVFLREAYIAYLISEDFQQLCNLSEKNIRSKLPVLKSVTELARLENNKNKNLPLFTDEGLSRFFPKYGCIEYYFCGMFVFNLLWDKKPVNNYHD